MFPWCEAKSNLNPLQGLLDVRIIALETSTRAGSVALLADDKVVAAQSLPRERRTAEVLVPTIDTLLTQVDWKPAELQLVTVTSGPGSFTGLRIAVTTAKTLAYAVGAELIAINTLEVIAARLPSSCQTAAVVMNAQRGQWFAATYCRAADGSWLEEQPCQLVDRRPWLETLAAGTILTGPSADRSGAPLPTGIELADSALWFPQADDLGRLAWHRYQQGERADLWTLVPHYYRPSYAEEGSV